MHIRKDVAEGAAVAAAAVAVAVAAVISTGLIIWRDRATGPAWHAVTAGLLFALMIAWSGHDSVLIGLAVVLIAVMLARAVTGHLRPAHAGPGPSFSAGQAEGRLATAHCGQSVRLFGRRELSA